MFIRPRPRAITVARIKQGLSQRALARKAGLSSSYLTMIENQNRYPSPSAARKICEALGKTFDELFELVDDSQILAG